MDKWYRIFRLIVPHRNERTTSKRSSQFPIEFSGKLLFHLLSFQPNVFGFSVKCHTPFLPNLSACDWKLGWSAGARVIMGSGIAARVTPLQLALILLKCLSRKLGWEGWGWRGREETIEGGIGEIVFGENK